MFAYPRHGVINPLDVEVHLAWTCKITFLGLNNYTSSDYLITFQKITNFVVEICFL